MPSSIRAKATKTGARPSPATQCTATHVGSAPDLLQMKTNKTFQYGNNKLFWGEWLFDRTNSFRIELLRAATAILKYSEHEPLLVCVAIRTGRNRFRRLWFAQQKNSDTERFSELFNKSERERGATATWNSNHSSPKGAKSFQSANQFDGRSTQKRMTVDQVRTSCKNNSRYCHRSVQNPKRKQKKTTGK